MRMVTIALASRRSGKQHPKGTRATKSVGAAWLVTLWGSSSTAVGTTAMAYSSATRSRVSHHGVPAFAARLSSLRQGTMLGGSGRSWSGLEAEKSTGGAIINAPLGRSLVSPAMSLSNQRPGRADTKREDSSLLVVPSRGCLDWKEGCMSSRAGARRDLSSGADQRSLGATSRRSVVAPSWSTSKAGDVGPVGFEAAELLKMSYRDVQKLAKKNGVRANQTIEGMVKDLVALGVKRASIEATEGGGFPKTAKEGSRSERGQKLTIPAPPIGELEDQSDRKASAAKRKETGDMVRGLEAAAAAASAGVGAKSDGWVTIQLDGDDGDFLEGLEEEEEEDYDEEGDDDMEARLRDARASRDLSDVLMKANPEDYGFHEDRINLDKLTITVPKGCCPGCGSKFQSEEDTLPGYLPQDKLEDLLAKEEEDYPITAEDVDMDPKEWQSLQHQQPYDSNDATPTAKPQSEADDIRETQLQHPPSALIEPKQRDALDSTSTSASDIESFPEGEEENEKLVVCQRCHRLRYYGSVEESLRPGFSNSDLLTPTRFLELLGALKKQRCLIIYLVDLFDFHGTFLYNLPKITGTNPVLVAGNKVDLLPKDLKRERVIKWVRDKCREAGLSSMEMRDVHLISSKHGVGIAPLMRKAREESLRSKRDIYVLGAANVGKSTFINYIIEDRGDNGGGFVSRRRGREEGRKKPVPGRGVTVSSIPGTTLDFLKVDLGDKMALYDTPGLLMPHTLTSRLTAEELRAAIPKKKVDHVTFRLGEGKVVLLGGLSRVEVVQGRPFLLTFFVSNDVRLHPTDATRVEDMISRHVGKDEMVFPPYSLDRVKELGDLVPTDFDIVGSGWRESAADVVIAGLGWVSVTGAGAITLRVWAPRGVLVMAREPLLPFESWETTAKFTGGSTVKKGKKKQGRRA